MTSIVVLKGGKGSGFHGHRGRPGLEGGSLPRGDSPYYAEGLLEYQGYHQDNLRKLIKRSYFTDDRERLVNSRLRTSLQDQYVVLGFDPLEMLRRGRNKIYLLTEREFEKEYKYWHYNKDVGSVCGFVSSNGSIFLDCGRWSNEFPKGSIGYGEIDLLTVAVDTITHEFGHTLWASVTQRPYWIDEDSPKYPKEGVQAVQDWTAGWKSGEFGRHTEYSNKNEREGFAESYMSYCATSGGSADPAISKTYEQIKRFIDIARSKYAK